VCFARREWQEHGGPERGSRAVLCDEIVIVRATGDGVTVAGTPFHGDYPVYSATEARALELVRLRHTTTTSARRCLGLGRRGIALATLFFCPDEELARAPPRCRARDHRARPRLTVLTSSEAPMSPPFLRDSHPSDALIATRRLADEDRRRRPQHRRVFVLNKVGAAIWHGVEAGHDRAEIVAALVARFRVEEAQATADLDRFLGELERAG